MKDISAFMSFRHLVLKTLYKKICLKNIKIIIYISRKEMRKGCEAFMGGNDEIIE